MKQRHFVSTGFLALVIAFACIGGFVGCGKSNTSTVQSTEQELVDLAEKMKAEEEASLADRAEREAVDASE